MHGLSYSGGKFDDITVVVSKVVYDTYIHTYQHINAQYICRASAILAGDLMTGL